MGEYRERILYVASTAAHLRQFHLPYLRALRDRGCAVTAAGAGEGTGLPEGVSFLPVPFEKRYLCRNNLRSLGILGRELKRGNYDLVAVHTSLAAFWTRLALGTMGHGRPRVVNTVHGYLFDKDSPAWKRALLLAAERLCAPVTDDLLVMNRQDLDIAQSHRLCRGQVALIPGMGVDLSGFHPAGGSERSEARRRFSLRPEAFVLLCAAEFSPRKNQAFLIRALRDLPDSVCLLLPGEGERRAECMALADALGLGERVRFPGQLPSVAPACLAADLYVSASRSEGFPFAVMEAMGCALPVLLSRVKGHEDLLSDPEAGRLYPFGDREAYVRGVRELMDDGALRARLGSNALRAVEPYTLERVLPQVLPRYLTNGEISATL